MASTGKLADWLWPTPTVNGNNNRAGASPTSGDGLSTAAKRWPTPRAEERGQHNSRDNGVSLSKAVTMFPAPRVSDANGAKVQPDKQGGLALNQVMGGALNPDWVDLLMGWPCGWTSLDPLPAEAWARWLAGDWWGGGWENDTPRITNDRRKRIARLRLLGNGQVPQTAAAAWRLLVGGAQ